MKKHLLIGTVALATSIAAHGAIVTETASFGPIAVGSSTSVAIQKFDPTLGTLTSIQLRIEANTSASNSLRFDNEGTAGLAALQLGANVQVQTGVSLLTTAVANPRITTNSSVAADSDGAADFTGADSLTLTGGTNAIGSATQTTSPYITQFTRQGVVHTFPATITSSLFTAAPPSSGVSGVFGPTSTSAQTFSGTVSVIYTYTPLAAIPEAGTVLFGAAMGLALAFRRQRTLLA